MARSSDTGTKGGTALGLEPGRTPLWATVARWLVLAAISDGGSYLNNFCVSEASPGGLGVLSSLLAEVWDFDTVVASPATSRIDGSKIFGKPMRAYYELGHSLPGSAPAGSVLIDARGRRWRQYQERAATDPKEVPPLPPERTNSNANTSLNGHDAPPRTPPTAPGEFPASGYTHHLIRDFMFLDATAANQPATGPATLLTPAIAKQFSVQFKALNPAAFAAEDSALGEFTRGTGKHRSWSSAGSAPAARRRWRPT